MIYQHPAEVWTAAKCAKEVKKVATDGMGTPYPFKGYIGDSKYGEKRYNGGCVREGEWYEGEYFPLPIVPKGYKIIRVRTWGYRIITDV